MEQELISILDQTLQSAEEPRRAAEAQLETLYANDSFPVALINIAAAVQAPLTSRQAALTTLRRYVNRCWSPSFEEFQGPLTPLGVRGHLKDQLLGLVTSELRQVRSISAAIVGKIATADYPDEWPNLLPSLLQLVAEGNDVQTTGALHVLNDVIEEGLGDELFIQLAKDIVELLYKVATAEHRSFAVRSLATSTFKSCIDTLGTLQGGNEADVGSFAQGALNLWVPFITGILPAQLPSDANSSNGLLALKIQAIKTVTQAKLHFPHIFDQNIEKLFAATWSDMNVVKDRYVAEFVKSDADGKLVNSEGLPYSLDLYVLEQIDFIQTCLGTKTVRDQIEQAGFATGGGSPFSQMMYTTLILSQIGGEDRMMWEADLNVFLSEECAVSANYTPRTACGDLALKLYEYFPDRTLESLYDHTQRVFQVGGSDVIYVKEAALFLWDQLLHEVADGDHPVDAGLANGMLQLIVQAMCDESDQFLRARGYATAATLTEAAYASITARVTELMEQSIRASTTDQSTIVQICAIRAFQKYCHSIAGEQLQGYQAGIIAAVRTFLEHKSDDDPEDAQDVLAELVETIQAASSINYAVVLSSDLHVPELLFAIASNGINNFHIHGLVQDTFESFIRGLHDSYIPLCEKLLPLLTPMLKQKPDHTDHELIDLATAIISDLIENGTSPLPQGLVANIMPHLTRILSSSSDPDVVSAGTKALTHILTQDAPQLLNYRDPESSKTGLEITLIIIDRLLRPDITESTAVEVGSLAAELVDKAGDQLGPLLSELLRAVAARLANAKYPPFVQSLILVFARLVLKQAKDVVDFLSSLNIDGRNGLEVVIAAWLAHTTIFSGYDDIYQNVLALCHLYNLQDPRLNDIQVQGDLIVPESSRIMTRSRAKANPDRYTSVTVPVKILKLLVQELGPNVADASAGGFGRGLAALPQKDPEDEDDEWEDEPDGLIPGTGMSREELLALGASGRTSRQADDETYAVLVSFFKEASTKNIGNFHELYKQLTQDEQRILSHLR